ncbi:M6 family metalloprotease domain-containing protein [Paraflavisolibacter sp. H34]|uniref:M6 family metalloprotease domain-containing protein n=1 Tax=Huijunlia imazamoxiresistens TaxID=3127457 RepID=UPI003017E7B5
MKGNFFVSTMAALLPVLGAGSVQAQQLSNCPASPYPITVKQADGSTLTIVAKGTMLKPWTETVDGYSVVRKGGRYEYAVKQDGRLVPSGIPARNSQERRMMEQSFLQQQSKSLKPDLPRFAPKPGLSAGRVAGSPQKAAGYPSKGIIRALMLLIKFSDLPNKNTVADFNNMMNQSNYRGTGSFRDFYTVSSFGQLTVNTDVFGWYTAKQPYNHYGYGNDFYVSTDLVREAVDAAEAAGVDFSKYDNDRDGVVDGIIIAHAGPGAEEGGQEEYIWSHRWVLSGGGNAVSYDGVRIDDYIINPERRTYTNDMTGRGVYCHEFGHNLGLPDLYDTDGGSEGMGNWSLMAAASWLGSEHTPGNMCAWCRNELGWQTPALISSAGAYTLTASASRNDQIYRVNTPDSAEYFLLENRQKAGLDLSLPGKGLAIYHINTQKTTGVARNFNQVNADVTLKGVDLEEADGMDNMDYGWNRGDQGDLYPSSYNGNKEFSDTTTPNAQTYGGAKSGITITGISQNGDGSVSFDIKVGDSADTPAITSIAPAAGPAGIGVAIRGTNFKKVTAVNFNGLAAKQLYVASPSLLYVTVPAGATSGKVEVVAGGKGSSAASFTPAPISSSWLNKAALASARSLHGAVAANDRIYVFGGGGKSGLLKSLEIYNPSANTWRSGRALPKALKGMAAVLASDGQIYTFGGTAGAPVRDVYRYNPATDAWSSRAALPAALTEAAAAATANGKVIVFGGESASGGVANSTHVYTLATNAWGAGAAMPVGVKQHAAVTGADGKIYVFGGRSAAGIPVDLVQVYNPATNTWTQAAAMPIPKAGFGAVRAASGQIYITGGKASSVSGAGPFFHTVEIYTPSSNKWTTGPVIRSQAGELKAVSLRDNLYALGGTDGTLRNYNFQLVLPPQAPVTLTATAASATQVNLTWKDVALNETYYVVERATAAAGPFGVVASALAPNSVAYASSGLSAGVTYYYRVKATNAAGSSAYSNVVRMAPKVVSTLITTMAPALDDRVPLQNSLLVSPNPAGKQAWVRFTVAEDQPQVRLGVYDLQGRLVAELYRGAASAGRLYQFQWDASRQATGVYFSRLVTVKGVWTQKIVLNSGR